MEPQPPKFLYHATTLSKWKKINVTGLLPNKRPTYKGTSIRGYVYLTDDQGSAEDWVEDFFDTVYDSDNPKGVVLTIDTSNLDMSLLTKDPVMPDVEGSFGYSGNIPRSSIVDYKIYNPWGSKESAVGENRMPDYMTVTLNKFGVDALLRVSTKTDDVEIIYWKFYGNSKDSSYKLLTYIRKTVPTHTITVFTLPSMEGFWEGMRLEGFVDAVHVDRPKTSSESQSTVTFKTLYRGGVPPHLLESCDDRYEDGKIMRDVVSKIYRNSNAIPKNVAAQFEALAEAQRGSPEIAMVKLQRAMGGGLLSVIVEHAGDLIHRMSEMASSGYTGKEYVKEKVNKLINWVGNPYGVEKEIRENIEVNAEYMNVSVDSLNKTIQNHLDIYVAEHRKLTPYNKVQKLANDIAIKCGSFEFDSALKDLYELQGYVNSPDWDKHAFEHNLDEQGNLKRFSTNLLSLNLGKEVILMKNQSQIYSILSRISTRYLHSHDSQETTKKIQSPTNPSLYIEFYYRLHEPVMIYNKQTGDYVSYEERDTMKLSPEDSLFIESYQNKIDSWYDMTLDELSDFDESDREDNI